MSGSPVSPFRSGPLWQQLLRHEVRLWWRGLFARSSLSRVSRVRLWINVVVLTILMHGFGLVALALPRVWTDSAGLRVGALIGLVILFTWSLSAAMSRVVDAFYERGDLDLLLAAPVSAALLLSLRVVGVAISTWGLFALFLYPVANVGVVLGRFWLAGLYLLVPLLALVATALALVFSGTLVRLIGVKRARTTLQLVAALVGAGMYLGGQVFTQFNGGWRQALAARMAERVGAQSGGGRWWADAGVQLMTGDPATLAAFAVLAVLLFSASIWLVRHRFQAVAQTPEVSAAPVSGGRPARFYGSVMRILIIKEGLLIRRDPRLISQIFLQLLYMIPMLFVAFGHGNRAALGTPALVGAITMLTATLSGSLAWLTISAEDAPDLLLSSPQNMRVLLQAKLLAAGILPWSVILIAVIGLLSRSPQAALILLIYAGVGTCCALLAASAQPLPGKRTDFQRRAKGHPISAFIEQFGYIGWGFAAGALAYGSWILASVLTVVMLIFPACMLWRLRRRLQAGLSPLSAAA